jgi:peptide/nickel transport system permease protein
MAREIGGRVLQALVTLLITTIVIFLLVRLTGSPVDVILPDTATAEQRAAVIEQLGLDRPLVTQYWRYASRVVHGDLGHSYTLNARIGPLLRDRALNTLLLATAAMAIGIALAVPLAVLAATRRGGFFDQAASAVALEWDVAALLHQRNPRHSHLRRVAAMVSDLRRGELAAFRVAGGDIGLVQQRRHLRLLRSGLLEVLGSEYVKTARARACRSGRSSASTPCATPRSRADVPRSLVRHPAGRRGDHRGRSRGRGSAHWSPRRSPGGISP